MDLEIVLKMSKLISILHSNCRNKSDSSNYLFVTYVFFSYSLKWRGTEHFCSYPIKNRFLVAELSLDSINCRCRSSAVNKKNQIASIPNVGCNQFSLSVLCLGNSFGLSLQTSHNHLTRKKEFVNTNTKIDCLTLFVAYFERISSEFRFTLLKIVC